MVEYGAAASAASTAAGGMKNASSGIAGALDSLGNVLKQSPDDVSAKPKNETVKVAAAPIKIFGPAAPKPTYEDASGIEKGMSCDEVTHRFGPPAMAFSTDDGKSMSYAGKAGRVQVECQGGKVASVEKPH
jgi:hypothetical protein